VTDLMLFSRPWRIDLGGIGCPVCLWIGDEDRNVPVSAALRLPARLPGCRVVEIPGEGHLWIARHYGEVLRWLADAAKPAKAP
jgi:pimeloyl-ACP methyl ester carboxylesterase